MEKKEYKKSAPIVDVKGSEIDFTQVTIIKDGYIRPFPNHELRSIGKASVGETYAYLGKSTGTLDGNWYEIMVNGKRVYIHASYCLLA